MPVFYFIPLIPFLLICLHFFLSVHNLLGVFAFCLLLAFSMIQPPIENTFYSLYFSISLGLPPSSLLPPCFCCCLLYFSSCHFQLLSVLPTPLSTQLPVHLHSTLISFSGDRFSSTTSVYFCLCSSLICHEFHLALISSHPQIYVFFLYFLVIVHLFHELFFCFPVHGWQVLLDRFVVSIYIEQDPCWVFPGQPG